MRWCYALWYSEGLHIHAVKALINQSQESSKLILILIVLLGRVYNIAQHEFNISLVSDLPVIVMLGSYVLFL
jgi:hypothetical protein